MKVENVTCVYLVCVLPRHNVNISSTKQYVLSSNTWSLNVYKVDTSKQCTSIKRKFRKTIS